MAMASTPSSSRRTPTGRPRGRPPGSTNAARAARQASLSAAASADGGDAASEPPPKRRRFAPGSIAAAAGAGDVDSTPSAVPARERSSRIRAAASAAVDRDEEQYGFAAAVTASVHQADDYKPREERSWEEFHPSLDIEQRFVIFRSEDVDGLPQKEPTTPTAAAPPSLTNGSMTPVTKPPNPASTGNTPVASSDGNEAAADATVSTPTRRPRRPTREAVSFYGVRPLDLPVPATPKTPKVLPIKNQTAKERLDLKQPSYRKTNRIELFESKTFGQARYVDKAMSNVGYQESDRFERPEPRLIKASDASAPEDGGADGALPPAPDHNPHNPNASRFGRVEYDMDEQDDMWLEHHNEQRKAHELEAVTRELFEITMTKIEKEWHALERRIPKPNPKPPQTHRPRSGSAAAVNGEPQPPAAAADEPDTKCAICEDGDCENTNAIVFCDGCNLAVHQECYGVPFIPEGQWLCRKCQLCGRGVPTCIFCPNTDGAFKQTGSSKWAHLLCAMWIPEVSLGNTTFMEPVQDVDKVPRTRWKLNCYICHQKMGACIQCGNKNCYQAFHVTCARRARLYLRMKSPSGQLAVLDGGMALKAYCHNHGPADWTAEQGVHAATRAARRFYRRNMKGRIWAGNHAVANVIAARQREEHEAEVKKQVEAGNGHSGTGADAAGQPPQKNVWRLPSGAPVIPQVVFDTVEASLQRFALRKRKDFLSEACRYWTLKREARRGAALLKRLQLQMDSFTSMELTRRNFAAMGPDGRDRLARRVEFAEMLVADLAQLRALAELTVRREQVKLEAAEVEGEFVDECYFPASNHLVPAIEKALALDKDLFTADLAPLQRRVQERYYTKALPFAQDLGDVISRVIATEPPEPAPTTASDQQPPAEAPEKSVFADIRERRKLGKRILKAVQPLLEAALRVEADVTGQSYDELRKALEARIESSVAAAPPPPQQQQQQSSITVRPEDEGGTIMVRGGEWAAPDEDTDMPDAGPPTPPRSNVSTGKDGAGDALSDGGVVWYLQAYEPYGTTVVEEAGQGEQGEQGKQSENQEGGKGGKDGKTPLAKATAALLPREDTGMLSEDLTDLDDDELKALGAEVEATRQEAKAVTTPRRTSARRR